MNLYGLPEFVAYTILVGISVALIRQNSGVMLKYWLFGWILIVIHSGIFMLFDQTFPFDALGRATLAIAGQAFIFAAYYNRTPSVPRAQVLVQAAFSGAPNLAFAVASIAYADLHPDSHTRLPFLLLIVAGAAGTAWLVTDQQNARRDAALMGLLTLGVYAVQAWFLQVYGLVLAAQWLMCWTYLAVAFFFLRRAPEMTLGVLFVALSFALWGLVFPVYSLLMIYAPKVSGNIEPMIWNLPKFLAAASMILVLLEELVSRATFLATRDALTELPNRRLYEDRLQQAVRRATRARSSFAVLVIDLNRFKQVNDTIGHQAGDDLLKAVAERFAGALRGVDTLARTGGDEFSVNLEGMGTREEAVCVAQALKLSLVAPIMLAGKPYRATASIGEAIYPDDGSTLTDLHAVADARMYLDKARGRADAGEGVAETPQGLMSAPLGA